MYRAAILVVLLICVFFASIDVPAQIPLTTDLAYDVASVKPNKSAATSSSSSTLPGGGLRATNVTLRSLINTAYRLRTFQLLGGPPWLNSERFDVEARPAEPVSGDQNLTMLRVLLADRFKLVVHQETREQPIYALIVARPDGNLGPQINPSMLDCSPRGTTPAPGAGRAPSSQIQQVGCGTSTNSNNTEAAIRGGGRTAGDIAAAIAGFVGGRAVIDRTGLTGTFDFELRFAPDNIGSASAAGATVTEGPTIFTALQEQLGLKLESQRGPVEFLIVDGAELPTPN